MNLNNLRKIREFNSKSQKNEEYELRSLLLVGPETFKKIEDKLNFLFDIFLNYSKIGDKSNNSRLTLSSFLKFLRDYGITHETAEIGQKTHSNFYNFSNSKNTISSKKINSNPCLLNLSFRDVCSGCI